MVGDKNTPPKVGSKIPYWFAPEGAEVLKVMPYTGRYKEWFSRILRLKANTHRGWVEVAWPRE
jgi:hypothetical protein